MKIFLDTADVDLIGQYYGTGLIDGVTTNPTLIKKSGQDPEEVYSCLLYTSPSPRDLSTSRMPSSA